MIWIRLRSCCRSGSDANARVARASQGVGFPSFDEDGPLLGITDFCNDTTLGRRQVLAMKAKAAKPKKEVAKPSKKLGPDRNEKARKAVALDKNFKQSRDIHEDRGRRQMKTVSAPRSTRSASK
jgi:hypothetical protein